jgi:hypothetical protein
LCINNSCKPVNSETLFYDASGVGPLNDKAKQNAIQSGNYYKIFTVSSISKKGYFYLDNKKKGTLLFDGEGRLTIQKIKTNHFELPKEETIITYKYIGNLLVNFETSINGYKIQETELSYDHHNSLVRATILNTPFIIDNKNRFSAGDRSKMIIDFQFKEKKLIRTYSFVDSPYTLIEIITYRPSKLNLQKGFIDPATNYDQIYFTTQGLIISDKEYFLDGKDITGAKQQIESFFMTKGNIQ